MSIIVGLLVGIVMVVLIKVRYTYGDFKKWEGKKPKFVWFPKYEVSFEKPVSEIYAALESNGFKRIEGEENIFKRGKVYGDFSANKLLLKVDVCEDNNTFKLYAALFVFFDTGDLWNASNEILSSA